jgi:hypothetical protein
MYVTVAITVVQTTMLITIEIINAGWRFGMEPVGLSGDCFVKGSHVRTVVGGVSAQPTYT